MTDRKKKKTPGKVRRKCANCGTVFYVYRSVVEQGRGRFCSLHCSHVGQKEERKKTCVVCGKEYNLLTGYTYTCSDYCLSRYRSQKAKDTMLRKKAEREEEASKSVEECEQVRPEVWVESYYEYASLWENQGGTANYLPVF